MPNYLTDQAFCVLPFIEDFQDLRGTRRFCCYSNSAIDKELDSVDNNKLRQQIKSGTQIPHCASCYKLESNKVISPRQRETSRWLKDSEVRRYIDSWQPEKSTVFFYDLRFDNKCNLACISCNETASSLWARELGIDQSAAHPQIDFDKITQAKKIYLAGGEPLIIEDFIKVIESISCLSIQPELIINTNLTRINDHLKTILSKIKNLTLTVSVDAFGKVNEYHRWPLKWDKFLKNLAWVKENIPCTIQFNSVVDAVTIINIAELIEIEQYADQWSLSILTTPNALKICNLPENLKLEISQKFEQIKNSKFYKTNYEFKTKVTEITKQIDLPGDTFLLSNYISTIDSRRNIDHQQFLGYKLT
jgi:MoaA/NifB/PqqE/SkfB family radical SAM enzyme